MLAKWLEDLPQQVRKAVDKYTQLIADKHPSLLSEKMGRFPGYAHSITLMDNVRLTTRRLCPVPLARCKAVAKEIQELVDQDIWKPIDKSVCQHQLVMVPKPDGTPCITTDLLLLNQFVVPGCFPLPHIKDLYL